MNWLTNYVTNKFSDMENQIASQYEIRQTHTESFAEYRNAFGGRKIVIVASDPTARYYQPLPDAIHIALNFAWRREDIPFDFLFTGDNRTNKNSEVKMQDGFEKIRDKIFISKHLDGLSGSALHFEDFPENNKIHRFYYDINSSGKSIYRNICLHPLFTNMSIAESALHFALFTSPAEIYLVGCDTTNAGYFYESSKEHSYGNSVMDTTAMKVGYARLKMFAQRFYPNTKIISVNPVGLRGLFEDVYTKSLINSLRE